jgi:hypothetical protein
VVGEQLHQLGQALVCCAVHGGFPVVVDGMDVGSQFQQQFYGCDGFFFGGRRFIAIAKRSHAGRLCNTSGGQR